MERAVRRILLFAGLILAQNVISFAQETKTAFGYGMEMNMYSPENFAGGAALSFSYNLPWSLAAGITVTASTNGSGNNAVEPALMIRRYFSAPHTWFFAQADLGIVFIAEIQEIRPLFLAGLRGGYRFNL